MDTDTLSPVDGSDRSDGMDHFVYDEEEVENICEDNNFTNNHIEQNESDSNAHLQKVQFQRLDKKNNSQAYFLFVIKYKEPDDKEYKINGYETSHVDLINLLKEMQKQFPSHTPDFSLIAASAKKCVEDGSIIFDILNVIIKKDLLFSSDLFQTFLEINYKYNLNCQSQNTIYSSTTSIDNSLQGSSRGKIDEEEEDELGNLGVISKNSVQNDNNYHIDSPIEVIESNYVEGNYHKKMNISKSQSPTIRNKATSLHLLQHHSSNSSNHINSNICINYSSSNVRRKKKKKSSSGSEEEQNNQITSNYVIQNQQRSQNFKEDEVESIENNYYHHSNQVQKKQENQNIITNQGQLANYLKYGKDNLQQNNDKINYGDKGYYKEDDRIEDEQYTIENNQTEIDEINQDDEDDTEFDDEYEDEIDQDKDSYEREDGEEEQGEEEKTQADDGISHNKSPKNYERKKKKQKTYDSNSITGSSPNPSSSMSGGANAVYEVLDYYKKDSLKQCNIEDNRHQTTGQYEQGYNQRSSIFQNGSVANYSQFRPQRSSLLGLSQSSLQVLSFDQQSMQSRLFHGGSTSQTMIKRNYPGIHHKNIKNSEYGDQNQVFINNTNLQNFESSISQSRSKRVIKISKDQIEARCQQQLLQAQTLGSISSTNSFDESPITKINKRDKKVLININQHAQKNAYSQLHIATQNHHLNAPSISSHNRLSQVIDQQRNSVQIQEIPIEEINRTLKSLARLSSTQQGISNSLSVLQQSQIKQKNPNTVSEVSICGNTVFEVDEDQDVLSVKLTHIDQNLDQQTQNTITQNNITEELNDSSHSSINETVTSKHSFSNKKTQQFSNQKPTKMQRQFYTHQDLDSLTKDQQYSDSEFPKQKQKKQISRTNPVIDDQENGEETKINHTRNNCKDKYSISSPEKKKKVQIFNQQEKELDNIEECALGQDHTELMFKSNNLSSSPERQEPTSQMSLKGSKRKREQSSLMGSRSIDSNSNNMSNIKVVEEYSSQYDFNSNEKVNVEDVNIGLVSGDLKKTDNKEKICNLLLNKQYSDLSEIGRGSYGLVLRARTPEGYIRALKIHCEKTEIEFKLAKFLSSEGTENLSANNIMTYNTIKFRDTVSKRKIEVIEMELADDSLKNQIYGVKSEISDEKFQQICTQLIVNVLSMHNMCVVHRDLKLDNILVSNGNYFLADFGISEEIGPQLIKSFIPGTDCFLIRQNIAGTQLYFSPIIRDAHSAQPKKYAVEHDPFKSDIYTVGLILLEIELVRQKFSIKQVRQILSDKNLAIEYALKMNINKFLIKDNYYILQNRLYQPVNILAEMLQIEELNRISSIKLCLICQLDKIILSNIIVPHHKIFPPIIEYKENNNCVIRYTIKLLTYEGSYMKMEDGRILRHGEGQLYKLVEEESVIYKVLVYEGEWDNDLPHGLGTFYFYQNEWVYEGQFRNGQFFGEGVIKFIDWVVYKGIWYNFLLEELLIPIDPQSSELFLEKEGKNVEVVINTHDKEGSLRNIGTNEIELQFEINTFRLYAMNVIEFKPYLKDKQRVRIMLFSKKSKHDFHQSARQQLLLLAYNKKNKRTFEVFIKYFKHEPTLDSIILEQLIQLLNNINPNPDKDNKSLEQNKFKSTQTKIASKRSVEYQQMIDPDSQHQGSSQNLNVTYPYNSNQNNINSCSNKNNFNICDSISNTNTSNVSQQNSSQQNTSNQNTTNVSNSIGNILNNMDSLNYIYVSNEEDADSIAYLNFDFFSKDCTSQFFQRQSNESLNVLKLEYLKNIGVPQQVEEESLIKLLLSKHVENLKELDLSCSKDISSSIFVALDHKQNRDSLKMLNLKYEALSKSTFLSLFQYPFLRQIQILDVSYSEFDDKCLFELTQCAYLISLQKLILCYCRNITFKGIDYFIQKATNEQFPSLLYLDFEGILSKGYQIQNNDFKQNKKSSPMSNQINENIHQSEQEMLLAFDRRHHLSSSNANLTILHQSLINTQKHRINGMKSGGQVENTNSHNLKSQSQISSTTNIAKQNAYYHYFPYTSSDILKQLEYVQKESILRRNLIELNQNQMTSSFSSSHNNIPSMAQIVNNDDQDNSSANDQSIISENNINSYNQIKYSNQMITQNNLSNLHSSGIVSLTNFQNNSNSQTNINNQILNTTSQQSLKNISSNTNITSITTGNFLSWVSKLTDKNIQMLEKFSKQNKLNQLTFLSLRATNIDDSVLKNIAKNINFKQIKELDISQCSQISNEGYDALIQSKILNNLIKINISQTNISSITSKKQQFLFFQSFNIVECSNITSQNICNYFSFKPNASAIRQIYLDSDKFFVPQVNQVLLECQRLEEIHIYISPSQNDFQPNQLTINLLLEKGYILNFYSSKFNVESVNERVRNEIILPFQIKFDQFDQIFINGIPYINLNRFSQKSSTNYIDTIKINRTQILDIPSKDISLEQLNDENIIEDLRKLFNSRNFLLVKELDISRLKVNSYAGQLLAGSRYTRSLAYIDISYSTITDEDLNKLSKSKYLPKLQIIKLNCCKDITEKGINYLLNAQNNLENLKTIEVKQRLLNLYLLYPQCSERVQIIADSILFKAEQNQLRQLNHYKIYQFAKYWTKIFRDNMQNINSIEISGFDENIIDYFLTHITDRNRVKKVIIDFSKKNQKQQTQLQNHTQFLRVNQIFSKLPDLKELRLDFSRWKEMTDFTIKEFYEGIVGLKNLKVLELNLSEWAKDNTQITDLSCMFIGQIFQKIQKINVISIDLSNWGNNNNLITDKSITYLSRGIHHAKDYLTFLSLNLNLWGQQMTNQSLILLHSLVKDLNLLSFLNLGLEEWGKDNQKINDQGIEQLTTAIGNSKYLNQLEINLAYAAHLNSGIGDACIQNLAQSLQNIHSLSSLKINVGWWMVDMNLYGFSTDVSDICIKALANAIGKLKSLTELDLNFDRWGYKNKLIKDESIINLAENIENLHALNSLSLNFDWWGLGNEKITEKSLTYLANKVTQLNKLTYLQLILSLDRQIILNNEHQYNIKIIKYQDGKKQKKSISNNSKKKQ